MKSILFSAICLLLVFSSSSQTSIKKIDIYYFRDLDIKNENFVAELWQTLSEKSNKFKSDINLINLYNPTKSIRITSVESVDYRRKNIENKNLYDKRIVIKKLDSLSENVDLTAVVSFNNIYDIDLQNGDFFETEKEIKRLKKLISKKNKNKKVIILLNNGFEKCRYCKQNLPELVQELSSLGQLSKLTPVFKTPIKNGQTLRPVGTPSRYQLEYNLQLDVFDHYELEILTTVFDKPLLSRVLKVSAIDNSSENIQIIKAPNGNYRLNIRDEFLGIECVKMQNNSSSDEIDEDCDCTYECLYRKVFSVRLRGVDSALKSEALWSKEMDVFFQCSK